MSLTEKDLKRLAHNFYCRCYWKSHPEQREKALKRNREWKKANKERVKAASKRYYDKLKVDPEARAARREVWRRSKKKLAATPKGHRAAHRRYIKRLMERAAAGEPRAIEVLERRRACNRLRNKIKRGALKP